MVSVFFAEDLRGRELGGGLVTGAAGQKLKRGRVVRQALGRGAVDNAQPAFNGAQKAVGIVQF